MGKLIDVILLRFTQNLNAPFTEQKRERDLSPLLLTLPMDRIINQPRCGAAAAAAQKASRGRGTDGSGKIEFQITIVEWGFPFKFCHNGKKKALP